MAAFIQPFQGINRHRNPALLADTAGWKMTLARRSL
jgi:hypothetical protein